MNFFETQEQTQRNTRKLVWAMTLAVVVVVAILTGVIVFAFWLMSRNTMSAFSIAEFVRTNPFLPLGIAGGIATFIGLASLFRMARLRQGGSRVAHDLGGTMLTPGETDPLRRRLRNVVEEMAIASGVPAPSIFVLEQESGINAFAAGYRPEDAAVAVTRGALETLNRDELQGVIAHEFSHVLNGDMRLNIRLMGPMFGILAISLLGRMLMRSAGRNSRSNRGTSVAVILGLGFTVVGAIGVLCARFIKAGVSRQREFLADASAVQFTRQTEGLAGALKKIAGFAEHSELRSNTAEEISHMLFANGVLNMSSWLATHPPLLTRIQALEPGFTTDQFSQLRTEGPLGTALEDAAIAGLAAPAGSSTTLEITDSESLLRTIGNPDDRHFDAARGLRKKIPAKIRKALESQSQVILLLPALMLHPDERVRETQTAILVQQLGIDRAEQVLNLYQSVQRAGIAMRLPLLDLALPTIKERPAGQLAFMSQLLEQLAQQNNYLELFEYALLRIFQYYVELAQQPDTRRQWRDLDDDAMQQAAATLLQIYTTLGHDDEAEAAEALEAGLLHLGLVPADQVATENWAVTSDAALDSLRNCTPRDRQRVIRALIAAAIHDGRISLAESELLRAFCAILECPLPPILAAS